MKLISKLEKSIIDELLGSQFNDYQINSAEKRDEITSKSEPIFRGIPIYIDRKCGYHVKHEFSSPNVVVNWDGSFYKKNMDQDPLTGTFLEWYTEDLMKNEVVFKNGILETFNHWDIDGTQLIEDGNGYYKEYWYDNVVLMEGEIKNGRLNGEWKFYYGGGTDRPNDKYVFNSDINEWERIDGVELDSNQVWANGIDSLSLNYTYPNKLKPQQKNQILAIANYSYNFGYIVVHENWLDFIPLAKDLKWYHSDGKEVSESHQENWFKENGYFDLQ